MNDQQVSEVNSTAPEAEAVYGSERPQKKRHCSALNAKGEQCRSTSVDESGLCAYHRGKSPLGTAEGARAAAARSAEVRREKAERRKMNALDWAAKLVEENGREIYEAYLGAIKAGEWRAADSILNRIYGRPTERLEMKQEKKPLDEMSYDELIARAAELIEKLGAQGDVEALNEFVAGAEPPWQRAED
jgi:hypothetical protein